METFRNDAGSSVRYDRHQIEVCLVRCMKFERFLRCIFKYLSLMSFAVGVPSPNQGREWMPDVRNR